MSLQPYQMAGEVLKKKQLQPARALGKAAEVGSLIYGGGAAIGLAKRALPFLNKYIPEKLLQQGLNKISPALGSFVKKAQESHFSGEEIKDFLREKIESYAGEIGEEQVFEPPSAISGGFNKPEEGETQFFKGTPQEEQSVGSEADPLQFLRGYDENFARFVIDSIKGGKSVKDTIRHARANDKFRAAIKTIERDTKEKIEDYLDFILGRKPKGEEEAKKAATKAFTQRKGLVEEERERFQQAYPQRPSGPSQADEMLLGAIENLRRTLGGQ